MGAIIGALYSATLDVSQVYYMTQSMANTAVSWINIIFDFTFPYVSVFQGGIFKNILDKVFSDYTFDSLWLPFYCCVTDLTNRCESICTKGPLKTFLLASCSLIWFLPPVLYKNRLLIDGVYVNNVPWNYLIDKSKGVKDIIAVNVVETPDEIPSYYDADPNYAWSGLILFIKRFIFGKTNLLSHSSLQNLLIFMETDNKFKNRPTENFLLIQPNLAVYTGHSFVYIDQIISAGYECAKKEIRKWKLRKTSNRVIVRRHTI
ncbi:NTE1 [Hepatospora eriocheir]|nr:NTE1 [Hepatospora eriocheir]